MKGLFKFNDMNEIAVAQTTIVAPLRTSELIESFILVQDVRESSKGTYKRGLKQYFAWIETKGYDLADVTRCEILEYKTDLLKSGLSSLTVGSYITVVRKFYEFAEAYKIYPNVAKGVKSPKRKTAFRKQPLTSIQSKQLLTHIETTGLRDTAIINLLLRTGLRTIEVVRANIEDITYKGGQRVLKVQGKGCDDRDNFVCLTDKCNESLNAYLLSRGKYKVSDPLFISRSNNNRNERLTTQTISSLSKRGLRSIGLDGKEYTAHSLRHTCAVSILRAGGDLLQVQGVLRHASITTSQIYTASMNEEQRLKAPAECLIDSEF